MSSTYKWFFYNIVWSESCPSSCNDPHFLMWGKTLSQVLEIQEGCEMRDALINAAREDAERESKLNKP